MTFSVDALVQVLEGQFPSGVNGRLIVAFSGGLDSSVLLTALAQAVRSGASFRVCALHVDHGLHADSSRWSAHCASVAQSLGIQFEVRRVGVAPGDGESLEAVARDARYAALREWINSGDVLLTAHHADDQLETVMLALLRGAGLGGLAGMPVCRPFAAGWHVRPLLEFTRSDLERWATQTNLRWISDPSNERSEFSRNFLRHEVIPLLQERWPSAAISAVRAAGHVAEGMQLLDDLARLDLEIVARGPCLNVDALRSMSEPRRRNVLRHWIKLNGARPPSTRKLLALEHDTLMAQEDRQPLIDWDGFAVRRFRGLLYADRPRAGEKETLESRDWSWLDPLELPAGLGSLRMQPVSGGGLARASLPPTLRVTFRLGGELLRPSGQQHHRPLKKLLQEADILPWWRNRLPLLWAEDRLVAVGDLWTADEFSTRADEASVHIVWDNRPSILAQPNDA